MIEKRLQEEKQKIYFTGIDTTLLIGDIGEVLLDDNDETIPLDVDFWARKELLEYQRLPKNSKENFQKVCKLVSQRAMLSSERVRIGDDITNLLQDVGYRLRYLNNQEPRFNYIDSAEVEKDQRSSVYFVLENGVGTSIAFVVHPDPDQIQNLISMQILFDSDVTEEINKRVVEEIQSILHKGGFSDIKLIRKGDKVDEELYSKRYGE